MKRRKGAGERVKRRGGETVKGGNGEKKKLTDSPTCPVGPDLSGSFGVPRFPDSKKAGFTILEAMVALVILSLALLALLRVLPVGIKASKLAEETTIATMLAQKKIEEARATVPWPPSSVTKTNLGLSDGYPNFDYVRVVSIVTPTTYLREVTVSVFWPTGTEQRVVGITTHVANYNP